MVVNSTARIIMSLTWAQHQHVWPARHSRQYRHGRWTGTPTILSPTGLVEHDASEIWANIRELAALALARAQLDSQ